MPKTFMAASSADSVSSFLISRSTEGKTRREYASSQASFTAAAQGVSLYEHGIYGVEGLFGVHRHRHLQKALLFPSVQSKYAVPRNFINLLGKFIIGFRKRFFSSFAAEDSIKPFK